MNKHVFVVCAYKESQYLEECISSLEKQTVLTKIIVVTSTPNQFVKSICERHHLPLYVNTGETGITQDWNFGYTCAQADYITIAHQDDVYYKNYTKDVLMRIKKARRPIICFTDYEELRNGVYVHDNALLKIKRIMLLPLRLEVFQKSKLIRRRILSLGNPISCPSVTFVSKNCPDVIFNNGFRASEDWEAWEMLSKRDGEFVYCWKKPLMAHRIHQGSETSAVIGETGRSSEDYQMFCKFWPKTIARLLVKIYSKSEKSNQV